MSHAAIPTQFSIKYWHDKTLNTQGWWRLAPLVGLALAAMATAFIWAIKGLMAAYNNYREAQKADAALDSFRAAVDPTYQQSNREKSWGKNALSDGWEESSDDDSSECTCFSRADKLGVICKKHGKFV